MPLTQAQILEIKRRAREKGISEQQVDLAMPQLVKDFDARMNGNSIDTSGITIQDQATQNKAENGSFVGNLVKGIVQPAVDYGKFVGESVLQASRAGAEQIYNPNDTIFGADELDKQIGQLTRESRAIISQMKSEKDKGKKKELALKSREIDAQIEELGKKAESIGDKKKTFLLDENKIATRGDIALTGAKATAGAASYAVPGSIGVGGSAVGTVTRAAGAGAIAGGLQGFGSSEKGQEINDTITGAAIGGATAGAISGAGQVIKAVKNSRLQSEIGKKIADAGTDFKKSAYVKAMGRKPIMREGGDKLLDKMMKVGIKPGDPDVVMHQADDILIDNAGIIFDKADEFSQKGVTIDKAKITNPLEDKLKNAPAKSKPIIQRVLEFVKADLDRFDELTPAEAYAMKGDYGPFGNWTSQMDADQVTEAKMWEEVYKNISDLMDESFKKNGYDDFRVINEQVSTAINAKKWASRAGNVAPNLNTLGLMDAIAGGIGFSATGVPGFVFGLGAKKAANSPKTASVIGQTLEQLGQNIGKQTTQQATSGVGTTIARRLVERGMVETSLLNNTENFSNNNNNKNNSSTLNTINDKVNHNAPLSDNNAQIIPQRGSNHPIPKFRQFATKDEMIAKAFSDGLGTKDVQELSKLWDEFAPSQENTDVLLEKRKTYADAGFSTDSIDKQLEQMGLSRSSNDGQVDLVTQINNMSTVGERNGARAVKDIYDVVDTALKSAESGTPTGPLSALGAIFSKQYSPNDTAQLEKDLKEILRTIRKESTGVAYSPQEIKDLENEIPSIVQQEGNVKDSLRRLKSRMLQKLTNYGLDVSGEYSSM